MKEPEAKAEKWPWVVSLMLIGALISSCGLPRPSVEEWRDQWQALLGQIPPVEMLTTADAVNRSAICGETLGHLRAVGPQMVNAPSEHIEEAALTYLDFAEEVFFDCPIDKGEHTGFEAAYHEMARLAAAVDALIGFED